MKLQRRERGSKHKKKLIRRYLASNKVDISRNANSLQEVLWYCICASFYSNFVMIIWYLALVCKHGDGCDDAGTDRLPLYSEASTWRGGLSMFMG